MRKGFTLVELMVATTISLILAGVLSLSVNKYLAKEKMNQVATDLISNLNYARNLAVTGQGPGGFDLGYVAVTLTDSGLMSIIPANVGVTGINYFSKLIGEGGVSMTQIDFGGLQFARGSGKLVAIDGAPLPSTQGVGLSITSAEIVDGRQILISPFGVVTLLPSQ